VCVLSLLHYIDIIWSVFRRSKYYNTTTKTKKKTVIVFGCCKTTRVLSSIYVVKSLSKRLQSTPDGHPNKMFNRTRDNSYIVGRRCRYCSYNYSRWFRTAGFDNIIFHTNTFGFIYTKSVHAQLDFMPSVKSRVAVKINVIYPEPSSKPFGTFLFFLFTSYPVEHENPIACR